MRTKVKIGATIFLVVCLILNIAAFVKYYCFEDEAIETITEAIITEVSKETTTQETTHEITQAEETTHAEHTESHEETTKNVKSLGDFVLFAYDPCYECSEEWGDNTSTGVKAKEGRTIAVDPSVIPYGTEVIINGHVYRAEDCGADIKGNIIDIYFDTHEEAEIFGRQYAEVFLYEG